MVALDLGAALVSVYASPDDTVELTFQMDPIWALGAWEAHLYPSTKTDRATRAFAVDQVDAGAGALRFRVNTDGLVSKHSSSFRGWWRGRRVTDDRTWFHGPFELDRKHQPSSGSSVIGVTVNASTVVLTQPNLVSATVAPIAFEFPDPETMWVLDHGLGHFPMAIRIKDIDGTEVIGGDRNDVTQNLSTVTFDYPFAGSAIVV